MDPAGTCCNCLVADGCTIEGTVENSIIFRGVSVAKGAEVDASLRSLVWMGRWGLKTSSRMSFVCSIEVPLGWRRVYCGLFRLDRDGVIWYFVDNEYYFKRDSLYGHYDDGESALEQVHVAVHGDGTVGKPAGGQAEQVLQGLLAVAALVLDVVDGEDGH